MVLQNALAQVVHQPEAALRIRIALFGLTLSRSRYSSWAASAAGMANAAATNAIVGVARTPGRVRERRTRGRFAPLPTLAGEPVHWLQRRCTRALRDSFCA